MTTPDYLYLTGGYPQGPADHKSTEDPPVTE
jgi:hypothetical protein